MAVRYVNEAAFYQKDEADIVDALRDLEALTISMVAVLETEIIGHIAFSPVTIESEGVNHAAIGLGPMCVLPMHQRHGTGSLLVEEGLKKCKDIGYEIVVVLGHPEYYPRFGFVPSVNHGIKWEYDVPDDVFMVLELTDNALDGKPGIVKYHPAFKKV